ncbi:putative bifunctional diguanylate cyclase/phosphodiesterase [Solimonas marina]|uniref:EAL domain-containing protein n=1 Tax=Solimonas marina TaxID=2714601 RepID=A0A969W7K0_9GAMM|nr:GGDEF domain-containing phosphodiesterase [Solimonas marina]NKF22151.1 EAL domain-containing protein [Solimonas marina]
MSVRTKLLAVMMLVSLAIMVAGLVIVPSLDVDRGLEADLLGRSNRISMSVVLQRGIADMQRNAVLLQSAVAAGNDPSVALGGLQSARAVVRNQLAFLPVDGNPTLTALRDAIRDRDAQIDALLAVPPDAATAGQLTKITQQLQSQASHQLAAQLERDNTLGIRATTDEFARLRGRLAIALAAVCGALLLSVVLTIFAYRRLLRPLGAVTGSLNAVLTGREPRAGIVETQDEFGDIVRAMRRIQAQAEHIRRIAYLDPGSKLPNRNSLDAELREVRRLRPIDGTHGLLLIGIDTYGAIRSGFGSRLAEAVLGALGERFNELDVLPTQAFRIDADVIAVLIDRGNSEAVTRVDLKRIAAEVMQRFTRPLEVEGQRFLLAASAGGAIYPDDARDPDEYVNVCLEALRLARVEGPGHLRFGERGHTHRLRRHLALTEQIRTGLRQGQFVPFFQPIVDITRRKVTGAETLTRWRQPDGRVTLPGEFIFVAEGSDLIADMTRAVLARACTTFNGWNERGQALSLSFNLSAKLLSTNVMAIVREALEQSRLDPALLCAEVTETALMGNIDDVGAVLDELRGLGMQLALDDFGTGYSSLTHLYRFDVNTLKIDPVLTRAATQSERAQEIIRSMVQLSASLNIRLIVEGVESEDDVRLMQKLGCRLMQGFHFSRAMPEEQFLEWVRAYEAGVLAA